MPWGAGPSPLCSESLHLISRGSHIPAQNSHASMGYGPCLALVPAVSLLELPSSKTINSLPKAFTSTAPAVPAQSLPCTGASTRLITWVQLKCEGTHGPTPHRNKARASQSGPVASAVRRQRSGHLGVVGRSRHPGEVKGEVCAPVRGLGPQRLPGDGSQ